VELDSDLQDVIVKQLHSVSEFRLRVSRDDCKVSWLFNGQPIKEGPKYEMGQDDLEPYLKVTDVCGPDEGTYTINVDDKTSTAQLKVQGKLVAQVSSSIFFTVVFECQLMNKGPSTQRVPQDAFT